MNSAQKSKRPTLPKLCSICDRAFGQDRTVKRNQLSLQDFSISLTFILTSLQILRYLVMAINKPRSRETNSLSRKDSGTSPEAILELPNPQQSRSY